MQREKNKRIDSKPNFTNISGVVHTPLTQKSQSSNDEYMFIEQVSFGEEKGLDIPQGTLYQSPQKSSSIPQKTLYQSPQKSSSIPQETLYQSPQRSPSIPQETLYQSPQRSPSIPQKTLTKVIPVRQVKPSARRMAMGLAMREKISKDLNLDREIRLNWGK